MLSRTHRLTKKKDFETVFTKGASFFTPLFVFRVLKNGLLDSRFAFVVSNKVAKRAVKRNLLKRRMRAAVGKVIGELAPGFDVVIMGTQKLMADGKPTAYADISQTMLFGLQKIRLLK